MGRNAFYGCTSLTSITIPDSVTSISDDAFYNTAYYNNDNNWADGVLYIGNHLIKAKKDVVNGDYTIRQGTKYIADSAFSGCKGLTNITIPDGVTSIGGSAFSGCKGLTNITIPDGVTSIGGSAFSDCTGLTSVTVPDSVTSIGVITFFGCENLKDVYYTGDLGDWCKVEFDDYYSNPMLYATNLYINGKLLEGEITIPDDITSIGDYTFHGCTSLTSITIPDSVTSIGDSAFSGCENLKDVYYTGDLSAWCKIKFGYDSNPMCYATNLYINGKLLEGEITIPDDITSIGDYTFHGCTSLTSITIPDSVTSIGALTFSGCTGLTGIVIPNSVTSIGGGAFSDCTGLTSITIPNSVTSIDWCAFEGCTSLTSITIPDSVTSIGNYAFSGCRNLTSITIPDSVTGIGDGAFSGCTGLTTITVDENNRNYHSVDGVLYNSDQSFLIKWPERKKGEFTIPDSVTSIGGGAFSGCTGLTGITIPDSVTSIGGGAFWDCSNVVIKTPENSAAHKYAVKNNIKYELIEPVTVEGDNKNITISTDSSVIPSEGVSLSTEKVENIGEKYEAQLKNLGTEKFTAYNIDLMKGEEKVQPNGKVTVSIAVPDDMDGAKCKVYRAESDGTLVDMKASLNDGKLTFTTDHFSLYIITQSAVKLGDVDGDGQVTIKDAIAILRHNAEVELLTGSQIIAGDLNGDGTVNPKDAILLLQYNAQIIDKFPIE